MLNLDFTSRFLLLVFFFFAVDLSRASDREGEAIRVHGLSVPLEYFTNGNIRVNLMAKEAKVSASGSDIHGSDLRYEVFTEEGLLDLLVLAEDCRYWKEEGIAKSDSKVRLERENAVITGKGFILDSSNQIVTINSEVVVVIDRDTEKRNAKIKEKKD